MAFEPTIVHVDLRIRVMHHGNHVYCRVFVRHRPTETFANTGSLTFAANEWPAVRARLVDAGFEILPEAGRRPTAL